jgi:hypothetical protein
MFSIFSDNRWSYGLGVNDEIDFCVWVLQQDGLYVPPFEYHTGGDGSLRAVGLNEAGWQQWLYAIIDQQNQFDQGRLDSLASLPHMSPKFWRKNMDAKALAQETQERLERWVHHTRSLPPHKEPPELYPGNADLKTRLQELWEQYTLSVTSLRRQREMKLHSKWNLAESVRGKRLWDELQVYQKKLPTFSIHLVGYPQSINYLLPPTTLLLTFSDNQFDGEQHREQMISAAEELAGLPMPKRIFPTLYTNTTSIGTDRPTPRYAVYHWATLPEPPAAPAVEPENEQQRWILNELANGPLGHFEPDLSTVRFLKERAAGDSYLVYYTFNDMAGRPNDYHSFLTRDAQGHWNGETGGSLREELQASRPVLSRDHPLLFLAGNLAIPAEFNSSQHFQAFSEIVDNGFGVTHVRLIDKTGRIMEDTVEQGLVLFISDHPLEGPVHAELYNADDTLVWRQPVMEMPKFFGW